MSTLEVEFFVGPTQKDVDDLFADLREADLAEMRASTLLPLERMVWYSIKTSPEPIAVRANGELACLFGVSDTGLMTRTGSPWLLGTNLMNKHPKDFLRISRSAVKVWKMYYRTLRNYVDVRNKESIRWLKWLGFEILEEQPFGPYKLPFHRFEMRIR